jgi:RNA polymerase sigma factor (sigma-70 family)
MHPEREKYQNIKTTLPKSDYGEPEKSSIRTIIREHPLLSTEEEKGHLEKWCRGRDILKSKNEFTEEDFKAIDEAKKSSDILILSNLRLVSQEAGKYWGKGLEKDELINMGIIGLIRGLKKFDIKRGVKFSTYATWWIKQALFHGVEGSTRTIRRPVYISQKINHASLIRNQMTQERGEKPDFGNYLERVNEEGKYEFDEKDLRDLLRNAKINDVLSLDREVEIRADNPVNYYRQIASSEKVEDTTLNKILVQELLKNLRSKYREIIKLSFGLDGHGYTLTTEEIARLKGWSTRKVLGFKKSAVMALREQLKGSSLAKIS